MTNSKIKGMEESTRKEIHKVAKGMMKIQNEDKEIFSLINKVEENKDVSDREVFDTIEELETEEENEEEESYEYLEVAEELEERIESQVNQLNELAESDEGVENLRYNELENIIKETYLLRSLLLYIEEEIDDIRQKTDRERSILEKMENSGYSSETIDRLRKAVTKKEKFLGKVEDLMAQKEDLTEGLLESEIARSDATDRMDIEKNWKSLIKNGTPESLERDLGLS
ncbi:MAG: hypothetical protein ABEK10_02110 [Candidatus Nanosalina sp.]